VPQREDSTGERWEMQMRTRIQAMSVAGAYRLGWQFMKEQQFPLHWGFRLCQLSADIWELHVDQHCQESLPEPAPSLLEQQILDRLTRLEEKIDRLQESLTPKVWS
jgi:hypothetical protein